MIFFSSLIFGQVQTDRRKVIHMHISIHFSGGQLGLWVGISAITVCEFLDLLAQLIAYLCVNRKKVGDNREPNAATHDDMMQHRKESTTDTAITNVG